MSANSSISRSHWLPVVGLLLLVLVAGCQPIRPVSQPTLPIDAREVTFPNGDITLAGTLTLPATPGPHPAVLLISGSGQQDRDEQIPFVPGYKPFQSIAEYLTDRGIAVLRYDDRGVGGSNGDPTHATSVDFAQDAEAGLNYLLTLPEINHEQIGLFGHSEGSIIAAMIAANNPDVAFVISMAGPAVSGYDLLLLQTERVLSTSGMSDEEVASAMKDQRQMLDLTVAGDWPALETFMLEVGRKQIAALPAEQREALGDPEVFLQKQAEMSMPAMQGWMRWFLTHNPADDWQQIDAPVLALFGGLDTQVDLEQNRPAMEEALSTAGNDDVTVRVFDDANHLFQQAITGSPQEYATLPAQFVAGFLDTIGEWITARVTVPAP
jgi:pimeloyl-ACP methyl ester carboxylesterase